MRERERKIEIDSDILIENLRHKSVLSNLFLKKHYFKGHFTKYTVAAVAHLLVNDHNLFSNTD